MQKENNILGQFHENKDKLAHLNPSKEMWDRSLTSENWNEHKKLYIVLFHYYWSWKIFCKNFIRASVPLVIFPSAKLCIIISYKLYIFYFLSVSDNFIAHCLFCFCSSFIAQSKAKKGVNRAKTIHVDKYTNETEKK